MNKIAFIFSLFLLIALKASPQAGDPPPMNLDRQLSNWNGLYLKFRLTDKLFYYHEAHYRRTSTVGEGLPFVDRMVAVYNRFGMTYLFNKNLELTAGPVLTRYWWPGYKENQRREIPDTTYLNSVWQYRFWQQMMMVMPQMGRTKIYHQFRFEQRWRREGFGIDQDKYLFDNRWRYKIFAYVPINRPNLGEKTFYFSPSAEIFLQSGKNRHIHPFEDFRVYTVFGYILNSKITFSAGHMYTLGQRESGWDYQERNIVRLNVMINLDFRKPASKLPPVRLFD